MGIFIFIIILLFNFSVFAAPVFKKGDEIKGHVSYIFDGDTISIDDYRIRFQGIDCPETMQLCKDKISKNYKCGNKSTEFLTNLINNKEVYCIYEEKDIYKRIIATCYVDGIDINSEMVRSGNAISMTFDKQYYKKEENFAKKNKLGLWQGDFTTPHRWRMKFGKTENYKF